MKRDGKTLVVERDFHGRIGARTCGQGAASARRRLEALELRQKSCARRRRRIFFNIELTPDYNWAHRNHFHLEVTSPGRTWFAVH